MKAIAIPLCLAVLLLGSCKTHKSATTSSGNNNSNTAGTSKKQQTQLNGTWVLSFVGGMREALDDEYPEKKPEMTLDIANKKVTGHSSCNTFSGTVDVDGEMIAFTGPMLMTRMACPGSGESRFLETLKNAERYSISENGELNLLMKDNIVILRFVRK